ncbi:unnamed protein product [Chrysodeixis includens]|uniref:C2H2-type domain-containing protein n=1 Tax=Chrysodeixis includens TaxID=689277 RepID=A0A9P0BYK7_CHRIL|nr:unnamed protein product [Chrysodeixis includens]
MLHNTGPYGPNEAPINMGAPVNMTPMSSHMNLAHNINNLSKMTHQSGPASSGHFNLPDYPSYSHSQIGMPPQIPQFANYQQSPFQPTYMNQNSNSINDLSWQNGMFPMNLNIQNEHNTNVINYAYDKRIMETVRQDNMKEQNVRKMPLNIPQIPNKSYAKHFGGNNDYANNDLYQNTHHNVDLSMKVQEKIQIDSTRRKNIEHTVKLIENILIHSSNKPKDSLQSNTAENNDKYDKPSDMTMVNVRNATANVPDTTSIDPLSLSPENPQEAREDINEMHETPDKSNDNTKEPQSDELSSDDDDVKPIGETEHITGPNETKVTDNSVVIKIEKASLADTDCFVPFVRDTNGFPREDVVNQKIIDSELSFDEATVAAKNGIKSEGCYECPHCGIIFNHPKRFMIHYKWHTFGLTNEKRMEVAKIREQRRYERREAKYLERMKSKEVTNVKVEGKVYPCKDCDKVFCSKNSHKNHRQRYHPAGDRECKICHKSMSTWLALRAHLATHTAESGPGFQCSECPKRFKYSHSLAKHSDTHLEKTHACENCPKKFGSQALLKMHMKTHERMLRGATFRCTYCGKGFFESYSLQVHERTHRNERPYQCDICNTSFGTNSSLKRHIKVSHNTAKPHQCSICRRNFSTESIRDRHELRVHGNPEDFKFPCKQCSCKYLKLKDLQKHIYKMHPKGKRKKKVKSDSE